MAEVCGGKGRRKAGVLVREGDRSKLEGVQTCIHRSNGKGTDDDDCDVWTCGYYDYFYCACCFLYDYQP